MDEREEKGAHLITMRHIRALAGKRGYRVIMDAPYLHVIKKSDEQISRSFDLHDPFRIDPSCTQQFTFVRIYFWIRGYDLTYEEPTMVRIERARHHPMWNPRQPRAKQLVYEGLFLLLTHIAIWVQYLETHHCAYMDGFSLEEGVTTYHAEHSIV